MWRILRGFCDRERTYLQAHLNDLALVHLLEGEIVATLLLQGDHAKRARPEASDGGQISKVQVLQSHVRSRSGKYGHWPVVTVING